MPIGKNICNCPRPPGGQAVCADDQFAICRVSHGVAYTECIDLPPALIGAGPLAIGNWALSEVMGTARSFAQRIDRAENEILHRGYYSVPDSTDSVSFKLPAEAQRGSPLGA